METHITPSYWGKLEQSAEENRFGVIAIALLIVGCLGGVSMELGAVREIWSMILVVIPTMTTLSLLLAVAPMKWILNAITATVLIDLAVITIVSL